MSENKVKLSAPWFTYYREIVALFGKDPDIKITFDEENNNIKIFVDGQDKADAIDYLLPDEKEFGNVKVTIDVIPSNKLMSRAEIIRKAFVGNPAYCYSATATGVYNNPITYVVFKPEVVQFWNDSLADINGNVNTLYELIAEDIIGGDEGIFFCTDEITA